MDVILVKILAAFLALSLVTTRPDAIKTQFDPQRGQAEVTRVLRDGCAHMRKAFDVESIDIDDAPLLRREQSARFGLMVDAIYLGDSLSARRSRRGPDAGQFRLKFPIEIGGNRRQFVRSLSDLLNSDPLKSLIDRKSR